MCNTCGCKDAESFGAETFELIMIDSLGKRETFGEYETYEDAEIDLEESFPREDYEMMDFEIINKSTNPPSRKHKFGAESFEAIEMFDQDKEEFIGEIDLEGFSPANFEVAQDDLFRYIHDSKRDGRTKMAMVAIYLQGRNNLGKMMDAESFEAQNERVCDYCEREAKDMGMVTFPNGLAVCDICFEEQSGEMGAESFDAEYTSQQIAEEISKSLSNKSKNEREHYADLEEALKLIGENTKSSNRRAYDIIKKYDFDKDLKKSLLSMGAESFEANAGGLKCNVCQNMVANTDGDKYFVCDTCANDEGMGAESFNAGNMNQYEDCPKHPMGKNKGHGWFNTYQCKHCGKVDEFMSAESFDAQTKLTAFTRGKDWEGKPYTGQIFPDHPDLDPELADRNQDGKMASWERAIGNQVARGKSRFKAPRKMAKTTTKFTQRKPITAASSLLPYAIAVGALATIFGLRGKE